jgi:hypothetical protein
VFKSLRSELLARYTTSGDDPNRFLYALLP